jgi:hypothetical protein
MMKVLISLLAIVFLGSCGHSFTNNKVALWTGEGWYHPNKSKMEAQIDFYECIEEAYNAGKLYTNMIAETNCMKANGYVWK